MGGGSRVHTNRDPATGRYAPIVTPQRRGRRVFDSLARHKNFEFPESPSDQSADALIDYVLEAAARLISPPKVAQEHNEFRCEDIATALRTHLRADIRRRLGLTGETA